MDINTVKLELNNILKKYVNSNPTSETINNFKKEVTDVFLKNNVTIDPDSSIIFTEDFKEVTIFITDTPEIKLSVN